MRRFLIVTLSALATLAPLAHAGQADPTVAELIEDLRHDDVRWNARDSVWAIMLLNEPPLDELHEALDSDDWQQRQLACDLLWRMYDKQGRRSRWYGNGREQPAWRSYSQGALTERMIEITIEGLEDDDSPYAPGDEGNLMLANAANGFVRLADHATAARDQLLEGLTSENYQQKFLCALALARGGVSSAANDVLPILLPHLADNDIREDAKWCTHAIFQLGDAALPALKQARLDSEDSQQRATLTLLILNLEGAPESLDEAESRRALNRVTKTTHDPTRSRPQDGSMWWLRELPK